MAILLCAATEMEIQSTLDWLKAQPFYKEIEVCITGVGLVAATFAITKKTAEKKYDCIVQAGIAGSFDASIQLASVYLIEADAIGDMGVWEGANFLPLQQLGLIEQESIFLKNPYLYNTLSLPLAKAVSVNQITTQPAQIVYYKTLGASLESMEGAALHYVGLQQNIPFLQLRSVSNYVGERNKRAWKIAEAIEALNQNLQPLLIQYLNA